ncbi:MAG: sensor histidine kinase [Candidatus Saccharimonadales bacterium]
MISKSSAKLERERLVSLINSMADGVIATDEVGKIVLYNGAALNILDVNIDLQGKKLEAVASVIDKNNQTVDVSELITSTHTQTNSRDLKLAYPDGSISNLYISIAPVKLSYGKQGNRGFVVVIRDITREKSLEEERDEFISVISHELRTPIAIAEGNIGNAKFIVSKSKGNEMVKKALDQAHDQILFLGGMINDLSTLSRAERSKLELELEPINPHELIEELTKTYSIQAEQKGLTLQTDLDRNLELLSSSKLYVSEILQNFITNAIKYTETGTVTLGARQRKGGVLFEISDTGIGISKADQKLVFDKFFRSEDYRTRSNNGTGLGLYVTMKLTRLIHAEIDLKSVINKGSTFSIYIPNLH